MTRSLPVWFKYVAFGLAIGASASAVADPELCGQAPVIDGDTIEIQGWRVHLYGIDAPELDQTCRFDNRELLCGGRSAVFLADHLGHRIVRCNSMGDLNNGELVAICHLGNEDLAAWLVRQGLAFADRKVSHDYVDAEEHAKAERRNYWRYPNSLVPPWQWRKQHGLPG